MLDIQLLRSDLDRVATRLADRGYALDRERFLALEGERKQLQGHTQELQARRNQVSKQIGEAMKKGEDVAAL
jgi:seryl-tRNA synthetase